MVGALDCYVSRTHARWLADPEQPRWQALDGSLLFADVSGFTALGERLAKRGRVGAEMLTDAMNLVFEGLLAPATGLGGDVLKFGGDAVLLLFEGPGHEVRAAAAALAMQRAMRQVGRPVPGAHLRCSIGVASGEAHLFLAGEDYRELVVAGPLAGEVCAVEAAAGPGQVVATPAAVAVLGAEHAGEKVGPGRALRSTPVPVVQAPLQAPAGVARLGLPAHLHAGGAAEGEHRPVTVAFLQFRGTNSLLEEAGPAALGDELHGLMTRVQDACERHGVSFVATDVDRDAGKVYLATGAPDSAPDDCDRMLLALREVVGGHAGRLRLRAGVNRGRAFVTDLGPPSRRGWTVMGDPVNLAARVMAQAPEGTVLATPEVLEQTRDVFSATPVEPFMAKGKAQPVAASAVGEPSGTRAGAGARELFGREPELALLAAAITDARVGRGAVLELVGEPGIGKTTLLEAALRTAGSMQLVRFQAGPYAAHSAFRTLVEPLRALLLADGDGTPEERLRRCVRAAAPELEPWLALIGHPLDLDLPASEEVARLGKDFSAAKMHDVVVQLLDRVLEPEAIVTVEDTHWLDEASGDLLAVALRRLTARGRLFVLTRRDTPEGLRAAGARVIEIGPIGGEAAGALVRADDSALLSPAEVAALVERSGGHPLFLRELLNAARAGEDVQSLPDTVEGLIAARIDTLPRDDRAVLRHAAVLGVQFTEVLLSELLEAEIGPTLRRLGDFVDGVGDGWLRFRHALLRDVAYEALPFRRRRVLHGRAADLVERQAAGRPEEAAELLALHCHAAHDWERSWRWSRMAGERALRHAAPAEAAGFFRRAFEAGRQLAAVEPRELGEVAERLGDAAKIAGRYAEAANAYREASRRRRDPIEAAELCRKQGWLREESDHYGRALRWYAQGLRRLEEAGRSPAVEQQRVRLRLARGAARWRQGRLRECVPLLEAVARDAERIGDKEALGHACYLLGNGYVEMGRDGAQRVLERALEIFEELGDDHRQAKALNNLALYAYYQGDWDHALELYEQSNVATERVGEAIGVAIGTMNIAEIRIEQGRVDDAEPPLRDALATFRAVGFLVGIGFALLNLGRIATARGDIEEAHTLLGQARAQLEEIGSGAHVASCGIREAELLLVAGRPADALELAGAVRESLHKLGAQPIMLSQLQRVAGFAKRALGYEDAAVERLTESLELARSVQAAYEESLALEALGDEAAAREIWQRLGVVARLGLTV
jgi:class 3 adenylate cyclase/tetratricopeptide (TPR) repeat protein